MAFQDVSKLLHDAITDVTSDAPPKITAIWKSALCSTKDSPKVMAIAGESQQGFHAGLRLYEGTKMREQWGPALLTKEQAVRASQHAAVQVLNRREGRGR